MLNKSTQDKKSANEMNKIVQIHDNFRHKQYIPTVYFTFLSSFFGMAITDH